MPTSTQVSLSVQAVAVAAVILLCGCGNGSGPGLQVGQFVGGTTKQIAGAQPVGGFLPRPDLLAPGAAGQADLYYLNSAIRPSSFRSVMIDPITIWTGQGSSLDTATVAQRQKLADLAYSDLSAALQQVCPPAAQPGPGVLRMRFALVDAQTANATVNTIATYAPYVSGAYGLASFAFNGGVGYFAGTATAEGFAQDGGTGAIVWEAVDKRGGTSALVKNTLNSWLDVQHALEGWSVQVAGNMKKVGFCQ
jgi:hypothetical protein